MKEDDKTVAIDDVVCMKETEKAILIEPAGVEDAEKYSMWIPRSQIHTTSGVNIRNDLGVLVISEWIYNKKKEEKGPDIWSHFGGADKKGEKASE